MLHSLKEHLVLGKKTICLQYVATVDLSTLLSSETRRNRRNLASDFKIEDLHRTRYTDSFTETVTVTFFTPRIHIFANSTYSIDVYVYKRVHSVTYGIHIYIYIYIFFLNILRYVYSVIIWRIVYCVYSCSSQRYLFRCLQSVSNWHEAGSTSVDVLFAPTKNSSHGGSLEMA